MMISPQHYRLIWALLLLWVNLPQDSLADQLRIAVASNFAPALRTISEHFESQTGHKVQISAASSGKHYAQIIQGAPFDIFFAANKQYPKKLEQQKLATPDSRFTYALGKLILWSADATLLDDQASILHQGKFRYLAIANPKLAPYGQAARQVLQAFQLWDPLQQKIIRGENIGQTFQFVYSDNAQLGFIARSQLMQLNGDNQGSFWPVPQSLYTPIEQQAVLLSNKASAQAFISFVKTPAMLEIIRGFGYGTAYAE